MRQYFHNFFLNLRRVAYFKTIVSSDDFIKLPSLNFYLKTFAIILNIKIHPARFHSLQQQHM